MGEQYSVRVESQAGTTTVRLSGEIDLAAGPKVRAVIADVVLGVAPKRLLLDFTDTTFMDSTGVNALVLAHHAATMVGATVELTPSPAVTRILEVSGVSDLFGLVSELPLAG